MMVSGKTWGITQQIVKKPGLFEWHRIAVNKGHVCSKHKHKTKWNGFFVESGILKVSVWKPTGTLDITLIGAGNYMEVPPGEYHRFEAVEDVVAYEIYWAQLEDHDIERVEEGN